MFQVDYRRDPPVLSLDLGNGGPAAGSEAILSSSPLPQGSLDAYSAQALKKGGSAASDTRDQLALRADRATGRKRCFSRCTSPTSRT